MGLSYGALKGREMRPLRLLWVVSAVASGGVGLVQGEAAGDGREGVGEEFLTLRFGMLVHFSMATLVDRKWAILFLRANPISMGCRRWRRGNT